MSDHRGYSPYEDDEPLHFDARRPVRGEGPLPFTLILSGAVLAVLVAAVFFVYRGGLSHGDGAPRPVGTAVNDIKAPAPAQAQPENKAGDLTIYNAEQGQPPPAQPVEQVTLAPAPEAPRARPAPSEVAAAPAAPVAAKPVTTLAAAPPAPAAKAPVIAATAVATPAAKPVLAKPAAAGSASVQIGAFGSQSAADKGWSAAAAVAPGAALGKGKHVETVTTAAGATLYRTMMTGFSSHAEAEAFCVTLKAAGKSCIVK